MRKAILGVLLAVLMVSVVPAVSLAEQVGNGDENYSCTYQWVPYYEWVNGQKIYMGQEYKCV